jgi:RimJ/RimL family protein N-acetyltransferase
VVKGQRVGLARQAERRRYRIEPVTDAAQVRGLIEPQRLFTAYALGQLGPELLPLVDCWQARALDGVGTAVAVFSRGGLGNSLLALGEPEPLAGILALHPGPRRNYVTCETRHLDAMRTRFRLTSERTMLRMAVVRDRYIAPAPPSLGVEVRRMHADDARYVNRLYNTEGTPTYYSGAQIEAGCYFGVLVDLRLVAVAGTHVVSPEEGIAVVGNVFTHPHWRNHGYARLATGYTTAWLLDRCRDVVLTVDPENVPAVRAYERLGYTPACRMIEAAVSRRELTGMASALKRLRARLQAHQQGVEVITR